MSLETTPLRGSVANYGTREVGRSSGRYKTEGSSQMLAIQLSGQVLSDLILIKQFIPAGAALTGKATLIVEEAFDLAASSVVEIGEDGAEATNGISLTEANLESVAVVDVSGGLAGEWSTSAQIPHDQDIGIAFSAGSVADATLGKAVLLLEYEKIAL